MNKKGETIIKFKSKTLFHILHEKHEKGNAIWNDNWTKCECSYCKGTSKLHFGLNKPITRNPTSWWVIKYWNNSYIRWTNGWITLFK